MISLAQLRPYLLDPKLSEGEMTKAIQQMSEAFTAKRERIANYTLSAQQISAYTLLYLPTNIPKLHFLLRDLSSEQMDQLSKADVIDFGTGPGTYALGWLQVFKQFSGRLHLVDSSPLMLEQASKLISGLHPHRKDDSFTSRLPELVARAERERPVVLFFGHSLNEIGIEQGMRHIEKVDPDYIIFIEPGTKSFFAEALKLRRQLIDRHYSILYPCPNIHACPMERRLDDWCHGVLQVVHDQEIERLCQLVSLDRRHLPHTSFIYARQQSIPRPATARYLQLIEENKFCFLLAVCMSEESELIYRHFEILKRHLGNREVKQMRSLSVGSHLNYEVEKQLSVEKWRVKLLFEA